MGGRTCVYTGDGQLYSIHDSATGYTYVYTYDSIGRLIASCVKSGATVLMQTRQEYNSNNQLTAQHWTVGGTTYSETYAYNKTEGTLSSMTTGNGHTISLTYDNLRRVSKVDTGTLDRYYTYRTVTGTDGTTTSQVSQLRYGGDTTSYFTYDYTYDVLGNIATYNQNGTAWTYTYDDQSQLESATSGSTTYSYTYDNAGNITSANGKSYTYGNTVWRDLLTKYDGQYIQYEGQQLSGSTVSGNPTSGNPISYYNGTRWTFDWEEGRNLVSADSTSASVDYAYDQNGLRVSKTVDGVKHTYLYASGKLLRETYGSVVLDFFYDQSGYPYAMTYKNGTAAAVTYYYITNLQGDVLTMITGTGTSVASYTYDPYGKPLTATGTMATINPLRYRGYYYDTETGFYYLQSRYYDPAICRFINADATSQIGSSGTIIGNNLFAYCENAPTTMVDMDGREPISISIFLIYCLVFAVTSITILSLIASPQFQQDWHYMCDSAVQSISNGLQALGTEIRGSVQAITSKAKQISQSILDSYAAVVTIPAYRSPREVHHIVAKKAVNAGYAREILDKVGIGYNSPHNLVSLKTGLHRRLHTNLYYGWANSVIISAYHSSSEDVELQRRNVLAALNIIRAFLLTLDQMAPF